MFTKTLILIAFLAVLFTNTLVSSDIKGQITENTSKEGISGITVKIVELNETTTTDNKGNYSFTKLNKGTYTLEFSGKGITKFTKKISITGDGTFTHNFSADYKSYQMQDLEVFSSSRRLQKITEAPSAISVITSEQLQDATSHGQIGKTLEHLPGVDVVQSGMNDFNINTRGFNNSINRRTLVLIDGRDPSTPMLNLIEWNSLQTNMSDIKKIEVVRGPGSALYGTNAYNGVINITTFNPKDVIGTRASITGGQFNTLRFDLRNAGEIVDNLYYKVNLGYSTQEQAWVESRDVANGGKLEYDGLRPDVVGNRPGNGFISDIDSLIKEHKNANAVLGTFRLDYDFNDEATLTGEVGYNRYGNEYFVNQTGRILIPDIESPFARLAFNNTNWSINSIWRKRYSVVPQIVLNAPASSGENSNVYLIDAQWNDSFLDDKLKIVAGASYEEQSIITSAAGSAPLLVPDSINHNFMGVYGQLEYSLMDNLQLVFAGRVDESSLFETQFSPKAALVWEPVKNQTFRLTVNRSFLRPSYPEYTRLSPAGAPLNLRVIDSTIAAEFGIAELGLGTVNPINVGNPNIGVETAWSYEVGYKGIISDKFFVTTDVYLNQRSNFISNPLPGLSPDVFTPIRYENEEANQRLEEELDKVSPIAYDGLAIYPNNGLASVIVAPSNIGLVNEYGVEIGFNYYVNDNIMITANYAHLQIEVVENDAPTNKILPNTSPNRLNLGFEYKGTVASMPFKIMANTRAVQDFQWIAGFFEGRVPGYYVVNLSGNIDITEQINFGFNVFNLLDRRHYQIFGGTFLERYATATLSYTL